MAKKSITKRTVAKKKSGPNKSQAIRDYLAIHPNAGPKEVCAELKKKRMKVAPALVSNVKAAIAGRKPGGKRGPKPGAKSSRGADTLSMQSLLAAKEYADSVGGVDQAISLLKALQKLG